MRKKKLKRLYIEQTLKQHANFHCVLVLSMLVNIFLTDVFPSLTFIIVHRFFKNLRIVTEI